MRVWLAQFEKYNEGKVEHDGLDASRITNCSIFLARGRHSYSCWWLTNKSYPLYRLHCIDRGFSCWKPNRRIYICQSVPYSHTQIGINCNLRENEQGAKWKKRKKEVWKEKHEMIKWMHEKFHTKLMQIFFFSLALNSLLTSSVPFGLLFQILFFFGTLKHLCYAYRICTFKNTLICTRRNRLNQLRRFKCCMLCIHVPLQCRSIKCSSKSPSSGCVYQEPEKSERNAWLKCWR